MWPTVLGVAAGGAFVWAVAQNVELERRRVLGYGLVASAVLFATAIYGLLTFWKVSPWRDAPAPSSLPTTQRRGEREVAHPVD